MRYFLISKENDSKTEIPFAEAKSKLSCYYEEKVMTFDEMLSIEQTIPLMFYNIEVKAE